MSTEITSKITSEWLSVQGACVEGMEWFDAHYPEGGNLQDVLEKLDHDDHGDYARWLMDHMDKILPTVTIKTDQHYTRHIAGNCEVLGDLTFQESLIVSGCLTIRGDIKVGGNLHADGAIKVLGNLTVDGTVTGNSKILCYGNIEVEGNIIFPMDVTSTGRIHSRAQINAGFIKAGADIVCDSIICSNLIRAYRNIMSNRIVCSGSIVSSQGALTVGESVYCGSSISTDANIEVGDVLQAREYILSKGNIVAGKNILAGSSIQADEYISAGRKYGIYAALESITDRPVITCKRKPDNIRNGIWTPPSNP